MVGTYGRIMTTFELPVTGRFDLRHTIGFGFGGRAGDHGDVLRLAFLTDDLQRPVGVAVRQPRPDVLVCTTDAGSDDIDALAAQTARIVSVDVDARGYDELVDGDRILSAVTATLPGLRPPQFCSAYEALYWAILSARRPVGQMMALRDAISREHGAVVDVDGRAMPVVPAPRQVLAINSFPGLPDLKLSRLQAMAERALAGELDTRTLRARPVAEVADELQELPGIGPFYSQLVTVRALGHTDALPTAEPRVIAQLAQLLSRESLSPKEFDDVTRAWSPWRTWACVAIRASSAGDRMSEPV